jgi:hypothetical protein
VRLQRLAMQLEDAEERRCVGEVWLAPDQVVAPGDQLLYDGDYLRVLAVEAVLDVVGTVCGLRAKVG